jgi:hypothetical protein
LLVDYAKRIKFFINAFLHIVVDLLLELLNNFLRRANNSSRLLRRELEKSVVEECSVAHVWAHHASEASFVVALHVSGFFDLTPVRAAGSGIATAGSGDACDAWSLGP